MVKFQSLGISGLMSCLLWTFITANQGDKLLDGWNKDPTRVSNRFQCDNLCRQLKSCRLAVYSYQERTCLLKHSTELVTPDAQDSVAAAARSICRDCADDETCIPVTEARTSLCISTDSLQETVSSTTVTVSMTNSTTSAASSVATLDITTLRPASSTPGTTAAPSAAPTTSSTADTTSESLTPKAITSETSPPSTSTPRVPTSISTRLEAVTPETPPTSTTTAVPTSRSTRLESVTSESPPTTLLGTSSASSTTETTSTPLPTTDTSTSAMPTTTPEPCPPGAAHLTSESVCVKVFTGTRQWNSTEAVCRGESFNSNTFRMITFKTKEKYDKIVTYLTQKYTSAVGIWVGLTHRSGAWRWEDGTEAKYLPWNPTEPNSNSEKCGVIYKPTNWTLHNNHCNTPWSAMCEVSSR